MLSKNRIKLIRSLQIKKFRDETNLFVLEGEKNINELLALKPQCIDCLYVTTDFEANQFRTSELKHEVISDKELAQISGLKTPNKALAVCTKWQAEQLLTDFTLILDGIQDPGNLGTLIRLADWYGIKQIICSPDTVDQYNPKVVQATMGSLFRVSIFYEDLSKLLSETDLPVYGAILDGQNVYKESLARKGFLVLGNEGKGISEAVLPLITHPITIPRFGGAESLNVSVAGAILLSEFFRNH